ncbi:hypothetical protein PG988_006304 [Apiospora saccharicola]
MGAVKTFQGVLEPLVTQNISFNEWNSTEQEAAPFVYINGYPGVENLTVANELCRMLPNAKVLSNDLLRDPVAAVFDRRDQKYQPLRRAVASGSPDFESNPFAYGIPTN